MSPSVKTYSHSCKTQRHAYKKEIGFKSFPTKGLYEDTLNKNDNKNDHEFTLTQKASATGRDHCTQQA
jgi:hypothetical protein